MSSRSKLLLLNSFFLLGILLCFGRPAFGYVDPGSGLLVFQSITAFFAGVLFFLRRRIKALVTRDRNRD